MIKKKTGRYIILSEPSETMKKMYNVPKWTEETAQLVKKYSDRRIVVHNKLSKKPNLEIKEESTGLEIDVDLEYNFVDGINFWRP